MGDDGASCSRPSKAGTIPHAHTSSSHQAACSSSSCLSSYRLTNALQHAHPPPTLPPTPLSPLPTPPKTYRVQHKAFRLGNLVGNIHNLLRLGWRRGWRAFVHGLSCGCGGVVMVVCAVR